jgi:hypothetical protein
MDYEKSAAKPAAAAETRAAAVTVADFSEQLSLGVLRAIDAQRAARPPKGGVNPYEPWIWCGIWVRPSDPFDPKLMDAEIGRRE